MNVRITAVLMVLLVALAGAYFWLPAGDDITSATGSTGPVAGPSLVGYQAADVSAVAVQAGNDSIALRKNDGGDWTFGLGSAAPTTEGDQSRINGIVSRLAGLRAQSTIDEAVGPEQVAEYGLQQPSVQFTVNKGNDGIVLVAGAQNARRTGYYVRRSDGPAVYLVDSLLIDDLKRLITNPPVPPTPTPTASPAPSVSPTAAATPQPGS